MYNEAQVQMERDDEAQGGGLRSRLGRWMGQFSARGEDEEEYEEEPVRPAPIATTRNTTTRRDLRISTGREGSITVMPVASFGDIQKAADRLKAGEPQIVNFEKTPPEVSERLIDFLNGVTYALDGYVERISEGAYLFTPPHIAIHADSPEVEQPKPFFDRL